MILVNDKADLIQDHHNRYKDHCNGILQHMREIGLNLEYKEKREFLAKEQGRISGWKITKRKY